MVWPEVTVVAVQMGKLSQLRGREGIEGVSRFDGPQSVHVAGDSQPARRREWA